MKSKSANSTPNVPRFVKRRTDMFLTAIPIGHDCCKTLTISRRHKKDKGSHACPHHKAGHLRWESYVKDNPLGHIKRAQEEPRPTPKITTKSERSGYQTTSNAKAKKLHRTADFQPQLDHQREINHAARQVSDR